MRKIGFLNLETQIININPAPPKRLGHVILCAFAALRLCVFSGAKNERKDAKARSRKENLFCGGEICGVHSCTF